MGAGAHQMEPPSLLISWVNPFPSRFISRTIFFCNALEWYECACCLLSFLYFHWLFPPSARETSPGNRSIYKPTRERVKSKGFYGRCRLHQMGSWWGHELRWKKQLEGDVTCSTDRGNKAGKMFLTDISWKLSRGGKHTRKSSSAYFRIQSTKSGNHSARRIWD